MFTINENRYTLRALRGLCTKKRNAIRNELNIPSTDEGQAESTTSPTLSDSERVTMINGLLSEVREFDRAILNHSELPDGELDPEIDNIEEFDALVRVELARLVSNINETAGAGASAHHSASSTTSMNRLATEDDALLSPPPLACRSIRELDIAPEKFGGDRLKFNQFKTQFECWVGRQPRSTPRERLMVLKKYVSGDPKALIEPLDLTDANYNVAWSLLEANFSRIDTERERILAELRNPQPRVTNPYDAANLRRLLTMVQRNTQSLEAMGLPLKAIAPFLKSALEAAVPAKTRQDFKDSLRLDKRFSALSLGVPADSQQQLDFADSMTSELTKLIEFLQRYVNDLEDAKFTNNVLNPSSTKPSDTEGPRNPRRGTPSNKGFQYTVAGVSQTRDQTRKFLPRPCLFCKTSEHNSSKCPASLTHERRCEILREMERCIKCFRPKHDRPTDCRGPRASCVKCKSSEHYSSMHPGAASSLSAPIIEQIVGGAASSESAILMTVFAYIVNGGTKIPVRVFLDGGSSLTFISPSFRQILRNESPVQRAVLKVEGFSSVHDLTLERFNIRLSDSCGDTTLELLAFEHEFGVNPLNRCPTHVSNALKRFGQHNKLADPTLLDNRPASPPGILVGRDQLYKIRLRQAPKIVVDNLEAFETRFGWAVAGPTSQASVSELHKATVTAVHAVCCSTVLSEPARALEALWSLDEIVTPNKESEYTADEESALSQFEENLKYANNMYTVAFPKRPSINTLNNNKSVALDRMARKIRQLQRDRERYQRYHREITKFVEDGHASEVLSFDAAGSDRIDGTYYMPHHEVITTTGGTDKWRIVFDCSSRAKNSTSLNEHLLPGPNLNPELVTLLLNFRLHQVAVSADIAKAYMKIAVNEPDSQFFRFFWQSPDDNKVRCFQMSRVTWGATSSGFILAATIREHFRRMQPESEQELATCLYADDFVRSFESEAQAIDFTDRLRSTLKSASMELAKWKTNASSVMDHLTSTGTDASNLELNPSNLFKVLGLSWSPKTDTLSFDLSSMHTRANQQATSTKRSVLSAVASVFDPLGHLTPFTLRGKRILQELWSTNLQWDQAITDDINAKILQWADEARLFQGFQIPRHYFFGRETPIAYRLHIFGDASPVAYACVAYIEPILEGRRSASSLVMSKSRLAPRTGHSLARLELLAALMAVRLKNFLTKRMNVKFDRVLYYTDSMITYYWATTATPGKWKTFVFNRVTEIQSNSAPEDWCFVPGGDNIADLATRGIHASILTGSDEWWSGPPWLHESPEGQPVSRPRFDQETLQPVQNEVRQTVAAIVPGAQPLVNLELFSTAGRAFRVIANVLRFTLISRRKPVPGPLDLIRQAEIRVISWVQGQYFSRELESTAAAESVHGTSKLSAFKLFIDENGLLRARTRLTNGPMFSYDEKNPIIIPGESRLAKLLIIDAHRINAHFGIATVLGQLRRRFWITRGRQIVKGLLRKCVTCRKRQVSHATQQEAPLPAERATLCAPFATTGMDFCGPFFVRAHEGSRKIYVALFTCTATRAVHFEVVLSMTTIQTHLALRRFFSLYPACAKIISDNGRSFVKASTDLKRVFNSVKNKEVQELLSSRRVDWQFICPRAPWHGGFYERLVGTFKTALTKTLGRSFIEFEEFRTVVSELAAVINQRPLTPVPTDVDTPEALTPAHFLRGGPPLTPLSTIIPLDQLGPNGRTTGEQLRKRYLERTSYFKNLSIRWFREYILMLRSANTTRGSLSRPINIGDVCLLKEDNVPRIKWNLVRIEDAHPGRDGVVRTYTVRFSNRNVSRRAAQLLYPLEVARVDHVPARDSTGDQDVVEPTPEESK